MKRSFDSADTPGKDRHRWFCSIFLLRSTSEGLYIAARAGHDREQVCDIVKILVGEVTGDRDDRVLRAVILVHVFVHGLGRDRRERLLRAEDGAAERRAVIALFEQLVDGDVLGGVLIHIDLLEHNAALELDVLLREARLEEHIREQGNAGLETAVEHLHIVAGAFLVGEGVGLTAERVDGDGDMTRGALFRALEDHVLDEVRNAVQLRRFIAAAVADPDADRYRAHIVQTLGDDAHAVGENSFYIHNIRSYISFFPFVLGGVRRRRRQKSRGA